MDWCKEEYGWNIINNWISNSILDVLEKLVETKDLHVGGKLFMVWSLGHPHIKKPESWEEARKRNWEGVVKEMG